MILKEKRALNAQGLERRVRKRGPQPWAEGQVNEQGRGELEAGGTSFSIGVKQKLNTEL